jgi:Recombinase
MPTGTSQQEYLTAAAISGDETMLEDCATDPYIRSGSATTLAQLAEALKARGVRTARGRSWHAATVWRVLDREATSE